MVRELCHLAPAQYGLRKVRAATSLQNAASQTVLTKAGFLPVGPADPADLGSKPGTWYERSAAVQDDVEAESSGPSDRWSRDADGWTASAVAVNAPGVPRRVSTAGGPMFTLTIET
jgi:hypothetical protein